MNKNFLKIYKNKKIIVTGSTGFKGSWLCFWLNLLGAKVVGIGKKPEKDSIIFNVLKLNKKIKQYYLDIQYLDKVNKIVKKEKPLIIFHLAAQSVVSKSFKEPVDTFRTNVLGSINILECVKKNNVKNMVYITSDKCYLNVNKKNGYKESDHLGGLDNYSASKASAELAFHSYKESYFKSKFLKHATARAGNVIGGGDFKINRIIPDIIKAIKKNKTILLRNPSSTRPWQHVLEPLSGYLLLGSKLIKSDLSSNLYPSWNFGPPTKNCKTVLNITKIIIKLWKIKKTKIKYNKKSKFHEAKFLQLNISKAYKEIKWRPTLSFVLSLQLTVEWYKAYFKKINMSQVTEKQINYFMNKIQ